MKKTKLLSNAILMSMLMSTSVLWGGTALASEEAPEFFLDKMVVTATRTPVKIVDANANINVITAKEIENNHYTSLEEAVRNVPGVQFLSYGLAGYSASAFRMNGADNTVVLIDGVRANHAGQAFQASYLNLDNVERIEVLKGSASALYGADAKGGVINIITKKVDGNQSKLTVSAGNFNTQNYALHNQGKDKSWSYSLDASKYKQGDIKDGDGNKWLQDKDGNSVNLKVTKELGEGSSISFGYDYNKFDFLYENTAQYVAWNGRTQRGNVEEKAYTMQYDQKIDDTLTNTLSIRNSDYKRLSIGSKNGSAQRNRYKTLSISDYMTKNFDDKHLVTVGVDYTKDDDVVKSETSYSKIYNKAIYAQDEWSMTDKWKLTYGARYDKHSWAGSKTTPRATLGYKFDDDTNMYVAWSKFFVAPTVSNYTYSLGNPNIKPETGKNLEIGINHKLDNTTQITAHAFKRNTDNRIKYHPVTEYTGYYENALTEDAKGFDFQISKNFDKNWSVYSAYTFLHFTSPGYGDNNNGYFPKHAINLGVSYDSDKLNANLNARASIDRGQGEGSVAKMFPSNSYWIFDLAANYQATKNIKIFGKVNNLFDKFYAEQSNIPWGGNANNPYDYYAMPGRNFQVGLEYSF